MNLGIESETLEFKKTTGEIDRAMDNIASMLNKHGHGTLYFGVSPDGEVTGQQVSASSLDDVAKKIKMAIKPMIYTEIRKEVLDGKDVIRVDFSGTEKPYSSFGRYYKRVFDRTEELTPDELKRMMAETDRTSYWENNLTKYGLEVLDGDALEEFYKRAVSCGRLEEMSDYNAEELLAGLGLLEHGKLTNAGFYLFSNRKPAVLKLAVYVTDERIHFSDIGRIEDNIFNLIRKGFSYIKEHINWRVENGTGTSRIEVFPFSNLPDIIKLYESVTEMKVYDRQPYAIDYENGNRTFTDSDLNQTIEKNKIKILNDNKITINNDIVLVGRSDAEWEDTIDRIDVNEILNESDLSKYIVVLDHQPVESKENAQEGADLQLSGHTHGGQVFPYGMIYDLSGRLNYGEYEIND